VLRNNRAPMLGGGALFYVGGGSLSVSRCAFQANNGGLFFGQGGAIHVQTEDATTIDISDTSFVGNVVTSTDDVMVAIAFQSTLNIPDGADLITGLGTGGAIFVRKTLASVRLSVSRCVFSQNSATLAAGAISMHGAVEGGSNALTLQVADTRFEGNAAAAGGAALLGAGVAATFLRCNFSANAASDVGGVFALQGGGTTVVVDSLLTANTAARAGGVVALGAGAPALTLSASRLVANAAAGGGLAVLLAPDAQPLALSGLALLNHSAQTGALYYTDAGVPPVDASVMFACTNCTISGSVASRYGAAIASAPTRFEVQPSVEEGTPYAARSGVALSPAVTVTLFDVYNQTVMEWPDLQLMAAVASTTGSVAGSSSSDIVGLRGATTVFYRGGGASFDALLVRDAIGAVYNLSLTLASPTLGALAGATAHVSVTVAPCAPHELFDSASLACICAAGAARDAAGASGGSGNCALCAPGFASPKPGAAACDACAPGTISGTGAAACALCPASSVDAARNTRCACVPGHYDARFGANASAPECKPCPPGGDCTTGTLLAAEGYWREAASDEVLFRCREGNCLAEADVEASLGESNATSSSSSSDAASRRRRRRVLEAVASEDGIASLSGVSNNCVEGNTGPLCALCLPGYALQGGACAPCAAGDAFDNWAPWRKALLLSFCAAGGALFVACAFFQPLSPALERGVDGAMRAASAAGGACTRAVRSAVTCACCCCGRKPPADVEPRISAEANASDAGAGATKPHGEQQQQQPDAAAAPADSAEPAAAEPAAAPKPHAKPHIVADARRAAEQHMLASNVAVAVGTLMELDDAISLEGGDDDEEDGGDSALFSVHDLEDALRRLEKIGKILIKCAASRARVWRLCMCA
jgi:hypothetical protein